MNLKTYLAGLSQDERERFAKVCGSTVGHIKNVSYDLRSCAEKLAIAIERETGGKVRCEELRPDVDWAYLRRTYNRTPARISA